MCSPPSRRSGHPGLDAVVIEELARATRVFREYEVGFLEHFDRAEGDVGEVADRGTDEGERTRRR
jgi:hypothetical protein